LGKSRNRWLKPNAASFFVSAATETFQWSFVSALPPAEMLRFAIGVGLALLPPLGVAWAAARQTLANEPDREFQKSLRH
jgi:hypothetical protein